VTPQLQEHGDESAPEPGFDRRRVTTGGLLLWGGTISIGFSTVVLLALLSRHLHYEGFTGLSTLFGLFFVASLIPSGFPLRAAALAVDGAEPIRYTLVHVAILVAAGVVISPAIAYALHLPVVAVLFVSAQILVAIPLAIRRGSLIAAHRFDAMGGNLFLEGGTRIAVGAALGLLWGLDGLSAGIAIATAIALLTVPRQEHAPVRTVRRMTSLLHTWIALVLLGLFVQMDILISPRVLPHSAARYDLAAVPSKGVYLVLVAVSTLIFPFVRVHARRRTVVWATAGTMGLGLVVGAILVVFRHAIGVILGQHAASLPLLVALCVAMSVGGGIGILINGGIALGVSWPWPPLALGIACLLVCWWIHPSAIGFAVTVLAAQVGTLLITGWVCLRRHPADSHMLA